MMKKTAGWGLLAFMVLAFVMAQENENKTIEWYTEYPAAMKIAEEKSKPVLMFFYAPWSPPSKLMLSDVWTQPEIVEAADKFICISINVDTFHFDTGFDVKTYPTLIISDPTGTEIYHRQGFLSSRELLPLMKVFPVNIILVEDLKKNLEINAKDLESLYKLAQLYSQMHVWDMSSEYFKEVLKVPDIKLDEEMKDIVVYNLAVAQIRLKQYEEAEKALEKELEEVPKGKSTERIMYMLLVTKIGLRKIDEAEKLLKKLKTQYPDSEMTGRAERILESIKK